jgi:hypothetical protein
MRGDEELEVKRYKDVLPYLDRSLAKRERERAGEVP